jgi:hypothetical protein
MKGPKPGFSYLGIQSKFGGRSGRGGPPVGVGTLAIRRFWRTRVIDDMSSRTGSRLLTAEFDLRHSGCTLSPWRSLNAGVMPITIQEFNRVGQLVVTHR